MSADVAAFDLLSLNPLDCPAVAAELPTLATAMDPDAMRGRLEETLLPSDGEITIRSVELAQAMYQPAGACTVRYAIEVATGDGSSSVTLLVGARVFKHRQSCDQWYRDALAPIGDRLANKPQSGPLAHAVGVVPDLRMALAVFPADGAIPALIDATDARIMVPLLERALAGNGTAARRVLDLRIDRGHYGRRNRCVLRYEVDLDGGDHDLERRVVYGKVGADGRAARLALGITGLRAARARGALQAVAAIPDVLLVDTGFDLALLSEVPGRPTVGALLKLAASGVDEAAGSSLERAVETSARVAASLHESGVRLGPRRTIAMDLDQLGREVRAIRSVSPALGRTLTRHLDGVARREPASEPLPLRPGHGDFTFTQLLFDGADCSLVDFDTLCQAEAALDVGHYVAHLRVAARRASRRGGGLPAAPDATRLRQRFLDAYHEAAPTVSALRLRERVALHEEISLVRLAVHSWQKFKVERLKEVISTLKEGRP